MERLTKNIIVMASGAGSTLQSLAQGLQGSQIEINGVVASRSGIKAIDVSQTLGIPTYIQGNSAELISWIREKNPRLIVLAGYLKKLDGDFLKAFEGKVINVHPSLLPKHGGQGMYGIKVHEAVSRSGDTETGATVHWVTENYDEGPIVSQVKLQIPPHEDPLAIQAKVKSAEKELLISSVLEILTES